MSAKLSVRTVGTKTMFTFIADWKCLIDFCIKQKNEHMILMVDYRNKKVKL